MGWNWLPRGNTGTTRAKNCGVWRQFKHFAAFICRPVVRNVSGLKCAWLLVVTSKAGVKCDSRVAWSVTRSAARAMVPDCRSVPSVFVEVRRTSACRTVRWIISTTPWMTCVVRAARTVTDALVRQLLTASPADTSNSSIVLLGTDTIPSR